MKLSHCAKRLLLVGILSMLLFIFFLNGCQLFVNNQDATSDHFLVEGVIIVNEVATETSLISRDQSFSEDQDQPDSPAIVEIFSLADFQANGSEVPERVLAASSIQDGQVTLKVSVSEPILCIVSLTMEDQKPSRTQAMLKPGAFIKFVLTDRGPSPSLHLLGVDDRSINPDQRFTVSGDASLLPPRFNVNETQVLLGINEFNENGSPITQSMTFALVDEGQYHLTGDIEVPTLAELLFWEGSNYAFAQIVLEPKTNYTLEQIDQPGTFHVVADRQGAHSKLIESWRVDPERLRLQNESREAWKAYIDGRMSEAKEIAEQTGQATVIEVDQGVDPSNVDFATRHPAAPECEHVDLAAVIGDFGASADQSDLRLDEVLDNEAQAIKENILKNVLDTTTDGHIALIAIKLGALGSDAARLQERIGALETLAMELPPSTVQKQVTPQIKLLENELSRWQQDNVHVIPGQRAPHFTLATIDGDDISLEVVLQEKDAALVDFWASWCGPCIATFPALKAMYKAYQSKGFEILGISIDDSLEDWAGGLDDNELPWINLGDTNEEGEMVGWDAKTALDYGVNFVPKSFLIDSEGCILQKDLSTDELERVLAARWGGTDQTSE